MLTRVQLNHAGVNRLLHSPQIVAVLTAMGHSIAGAAGDGHAVDVDVGPNRTRVEVRTDTFDAMRAEAKHRRLTGSIGAGRR